jgi:hypothetical protein
MRERENWNQLVKRTKDNSYANVVHKCGAMVLPEGISSSRDVCHFCDFKYQPYLANPIFRPHFETFIPEMVSILFE